jgi:alkyldihydroxyacetonephosphate synthase
MPDFVDFGSTYAGIDVSREKRPQKDMDILPPNFNHEFLTELGDNSFSRRSFMKWERIMHSHGSSLQDVFTLRYSKFARFADIVIYPADHNQCEVTSIPILNNPSYIETSGSC